jgi:hypothetical protein
MSVIMRVFGARVNPNPDLGAAGLLWLEAISYAIRVQQHNNSTMYEKSGADLSIDSLCLLQAGSR